MYFKLNGGYLSKTKNFFALQKILTVFFMCAARCKLENVKEDDKFLHDHIYPVYTKTHLQRKFSRQVYMAPSKSFYMCNE